MKLELSEPTLRELLARAAEAESDAEALNLAVQAVARETRRRRVTAQHVQALRTAWVASGRSLLELVG